jgi:hypothetical protein
MTMLSFGVKEFLRNKGAPDKRVKMVLIEINPNAINTFYIYWETVIVCKHCIGFILYHVFGAPLVMNGD